MKPENKILLIAILYAFLGIGIIVFANWSINHYQPQTIFAFTIITIAYNIFLGFSFQRCWNIVFQRQKRKEESLQ